MNTIKSKAKFAAIKATSIVLGTGYVAGKLFAVGCKNLEANIITKIDNNYSKKEVRLHRMKSYGVVMNQINDVNDQVHEKAEEIKRRLMKKAVTQEILLTGQERISHVN